MKGQGPLFDDLALHAERKMGEMLAETERAKGELKRGSVVPPGNRGESPPTLAELGLSKKESSRAQTPMKRHVSILRLEVGERAFKRQIQELLKSPESLEREGEKRP
jgi:hypothetical protein